MTLTEVCAKTANPQILMHWITEVEKAQSIDELMTSQSILVRRDFPDYEMLDAMMASALKKLLNSHVHFRKRVSVKEQRAQKHDRFLRGRQIAHMIHEHFRATGAYEAVQGPSDLINRRLQNDDVQDFDGTRHCFQQMKHSQIQSWKVCTSQNCRILFSFRLYWLCIHKKMFETIDKQAILD